MRGSQQQINFYPEEQPDSPDEEDVVSLNSQLRKSKSVDSTGIETPAVNPEVTPETKQPPLIKAKSEHNLNSSTLSLHLCKYICLIMPSNSFDELTECLW